MSFINKCIWKHYAPAKSTAKPAIVSRDGIKFFPPPPRFSIKLASDGSIINGLTVEDTIPGERDTSVLPKEHRAGSIGNLIGEGCLIFITKTGKKFSPRLGEFSFIFNSRKEVA